MSRQIIRQRCLLPISVPPHEVFFFIYTSHQPHSLLGFHAFQQDWFQRTQNSAPISTFGLSLQVMLAGTHAYKHMADPQPCFEQARLCRWDVQCKTSPKCAYIEPMLQWNAIPEGCVVHGLCNYFDVFTSRERYVTEVYCRLIYLI